MTLQAGKALKMGLALWAALALAGCASSVQRSEEHRAATFKVSAEYPIGAVNVSATPEALAKIQEAKKKFDPDRLRSAIEYALNFDKMYAKPGRPFGHPPVRTAHREHSPQRRRPRY